MARLFRIENKIINHSNVTDLYIGGFLFNATSNKSFSHNNYKPINRNVESVMMPSPQFLCGFLFKKKFLPKIDSKIYHYIQTRCFHFTKLISKQKSDEESKKEIEIKEPLLTRIWQEIVHYYHGFRLAFVNIGISTKLLVQVIKGKRLTRRERRQLIRTTGDMFRLIPFSVFIVVPFMEFLLPLYIKFLPGMMPSTFRSIDYKENALKRNLKVKLEMAIFLQETLDQMVVLKKDKQSKLSKSFQEFFDKAKNPSESVTKEDIIKFANKFEDEITLDTLTRDQLVAICRILEIHSMGPASMLRFQIRLKLRAITADDHLIASDGVDELNLQELKNACSARGMNHDLPEYKLRHQLSEWIDLSLNERIPVVLLLLARALDVAQETKEIEKLDKGIEALAPKVEELKKTIGALSQECCDKTKCVIDESEGSVDSKTKIGVIKDEERRIKEEREEEIFSSRYQNHSITSEDADLIYDALVKLCSSKNELLIEKRVLKHLKHEINDYFEDIQELKEVSTGTNCQICLAAEILSKKINSMLLKLECTLDDMDKCKGMVTPNQLANVEAMCEEVQIRDLINTLSQMGEKVDDLRLKDIEYFLRKIDKEKEGNLKVDNILKVIETLSQEKVNLDEKQFVDVVDCLQKEKADQSSPSCKRGKKSQKNIKSVCEKLRNKRNRKESDDY